VDPVPDPLLLRISGSSGNRTRDPWICSRKRWPLDHRGGLQLLASLLVSVRSIIIKSWNLHLIPFESSGDIVHVEKSGRFDVDVVLKSHFKRIGELSDDICDRLYPKITTKVTISDVPWCVDNTV
jgi:hypothetical protein